VFVRQSPGLQPPFLNPAQELGSGILDPLIQVGPCRREFQQVASPTDDGPAILDDGLVLDPGMHAGTENAGNITGASPGGRVDKKHGIIRHTGRCEGEVKVVFGTLVSDPERSARSDHSGASHTRARLSAAWTSMSSTRSSLSWALPTAHKMSLYVICSELPRGSRHSGNVLRSTNCQGV